MRRNRNELEALATMTAELESAADRVAAEKVLLSHTTGALGFRRGLLLAPGEPPLVGVSTGTGTPAPVRLADAGAADVGAADVGAVGRRAQQEHRPVAVRALDALADPVAAAMLPSARNLVVIAVGSGPEAPVLLLEHGGRASGERLARRTMLMVGQFAAHGMLALASLSLLADQERLASADGLTGLANRRQFDIILGRETASAARRNEPLTLALIDIDHFKAVNDTAGHLAGDEVLRQLAAVLVSACREVDLVARFGGEEFALLLPSCHADAAVGVLARIDEAMRATPALAGITVSSGVATVPEHAADGRDLVAAADAALYDSKRAGRDRVTVSSATGPRVTRAT